MKKKSRLALGCALLVCAMILLGTSLFNSKSNNAIKIEINSWLKRDRVVPLGKIELRSTIIIGFRISQQIKESSKQTIKGELYINDVLISTDNISHIDSSGNNLGFDISLSKSDLSYDRPMSIPDGKYTIVIKLLNEKRQLLAQCQKVLNGNELSRLFHGLNEVLERPIYLELADNTRDMETQLAGTSQESSHKDYLVFRKSYLERVYPSTKPNTRELLESIYAEVSRNEYKPLTFSIYARKNLGRVQVSVSPLSGVRGTLAADAVTLGSVGKLTEITGKEKETDIIYYRWAPKIIESREVAIPQDRSQRYWLTLKTGPETIPGDYYGVIAVKPRFSQITEIPMHIRVLPFRLTDTDIQYGMMMTYGFYELDNSTWARKEKDLIRRSGMEIYRDFREHGLTMVYPHSHFYFKTNAAGEPIIESLKASLEAYKKLNFSGPFCWYVGHLLQTAKPFHPGSILNYESQVAQKRLRLLLKSYETVANEAGISKDKLIVQLVDEPDSLDRVAAGKELNRTTRQMGFKTLVTRPSWPDVDITCTGIPHNNSEAHRLRRLSRKWWIYPNKALHTKNRAYTRYVFGFGAWRWGVDGVVPWTFQMSQGCNGNPFTILDGPEKMVTYPGPNGPIPTPTWESIRDGINDYKYIYLLENLIDTAKYAGNLKAFFFDRQLEQLKQNLQEAPGEEEENFGDWPPESFEKRRKQIVDWALELIADSP